MQIKFNRIAAVSLAVALSAGAYFLYQKKKKAG